MNCDSIDEVTRDNSRFTNELGRSKKGGLGSLHTEAVARSPSRSRARAASPVAT